MTAISITYQASLHKESLYGGENHGVGGQVFNCYKRKFKAVLNFQQDQLENPFENPLDVQYPNQRRKKPGQQVDSTGLLSCGPARPLEENLDKYLPFLQQVSLENPSFHESSRSRFSCRTTLQRYGSIPRASRPSTVIAFLKLCVTVSVRWMLLLPEMKVGE